MVVEREAKTGVEMEKPGWEPTRGWEPTMEADRTT
jgi:hypothetical protein